MTLKEQMQDDLKTAMKAQNVEARDALRFTLAAFKNAEIDKGGPLDDAEALSILQKQVKSRNESIEQFQKADRQELVDREEAQLSYLTVYLPTAMSDDELLALIKDAVAETGASGPAGMGKIMPIVLERAAGRADGKRISTLAKTVLADSGS